MYRIDDLLTECADITLGEGNNSIPSGLTRGTYDAIWSGLIQCMRSNAKMHKGIVLPNFARLSFQKELKKPKFIMANNFLKTYGIKFRARQASKSPETATKDLNFAKLAQLAKCNKDVAKTVYREITSHIGELLKDGGNMIAIVFKGIGILRGDRFRLQFFFDGEKGARMSMKTSASFTKNAPTTAKNLALFGSNSQQQQQQSSNNVETTISDMKNNSNNSNNNNNSVLPKINGNASGMNNTLNSTMNNSSRSRKSFNKSKSAPRLMKGLSISDTIGTAPRNKLLLSEKDLETANLALMHKKQQRKDLRRRLDEKEFRDEILSMHKDVITAEREREAKQRKESQFAEEQKEQGEERMERLRAERAEYLAGQKMHWPFSVEEEVRVERKDKDKKFRKELDEQNATRPHKTKERRRPEDSIDVKDPDTWFQPSEGNVYPKFLTPSRQPNRMTDKDGKDPLVLQLAYKRYEKTLREQLKTLKHQSKEIQEREKQKDLEIAHRHKKRLEIQRETTKYQLKQAEHRLKIKEKLRRENHHETNPDPSRAYPMEQLRDAHRLNRAKASLRHALDAQVEARSEIKNMRTTIEKAEDNYFLGCVQEQLELDRAHRIKKKYDEQQAMMGTWKRQEAFNKQLKKLEAMRDGLVVREGGSVVNQDEIALPGDAAKE